MGKECEIAHAQDLDNGQEVHHLFIFSAVALGVGFLCGLLLLYYLGAKTKKAEFRQIAHDSEN